MRPIVDKLLNILDKYPNSLSIEELDELLIKIENIVARMRYGPLVENLPGYGVVLDRRILCIPSDNSIEIKRLDKVEVGPIERIIDVLKGGNVNPEFLEKLRQMESESASILDMPVLKKDGDG